MLHAAVFNAATAQAPVVYLDMSNWPAFRAHIISICEADYGDPGHQLVTNIPHVLQPFATQPVAPMDPEEMTEADVKRLHQDIQTFRTAEAAFATADRLLHTYIYTHIVPHSVAVIKANPAYPAYLALPTTNRSRALFELLRDTHSTGTGISKFLRTKGLLLNRQGLQPHEEHLAQFNQLASSFIHDFEDPDRPGYILTQNFLSYLYILSVDPVYFKDAVTPEFVNYPQGRFPSVTDLQNRLQQFKNSKDLNTVHTDSASAQGASALITAAPFTASTTAPHPAQNLLRLPPGASKLVDGRAYWDVPCRLCLAQYKKAYHTHTPDRCHLNPSYKNYTGPRTTSTAGTAANKPRANVAAIVPPAAPSTQLLTPSDLMAAFLAQLPVARAPSPAAPTADAIAKALLAQLDATDAANASSTA
jgi:hypothetical protein